MLFKSISIIGMVILSLASDVRGNDDRHNSNSWNLSQAVSNVVPYAVGGVAIVGSVYGAYSGATFASETLQIPVKSMLSWGGYSVLAGRIGWFSGDIYSGLDETYVFKWID